MTPLEKLRQKLERSLSEMEALSKAVVNEKGEVRSFTADEQKKYSELEAEVEATKSAVKREENLRDSKKVLDHLNAPKTQNTQVEIARHDGCDEEGNYKGFRSLGEQLQAVARSSIPGARVDERLGKIRAASGMGEINDSDGGFLIQPDFMVEMIRDVYNAGTIASLCRRVPISSASNSLEMVTVDETSRADGSRFGGVQAYWRAEAATVSGSAPKLRNIRMALEDLMAICYSTDQLLADSAALGAIIKDAFTEEMAFKLDAAIIEGDGAGKPLGLLNSAALISIAKESGQTNDTVVFANVSKMRAQATKKGRRQGVWLCNAEVLPQLEQLYVAVGTAGGIPVYSPAGQNGAEGEKLYGRPIVEAEACAKLGDVGDIIFADLSEYLLIEKAGIDAQQSIHVRFLYGENTFRFTMRVNGQPMWKTAVTPYKGTSGVKYSPYLTIAAR